MRKDVGLHAVNKTNWLHILAAKSTSKADKNNNRKPHNNNKQLGKCPRFETFAAICHSLFITHVCANWENLLISSPLLSSNWLIISEMHWMHPLPRSNWYYQLLSNLLFGGFSQVYASHVGQLTCQQVEEHKIIGNSTNSIFNLRSHLGFPNWEQSDASCPRSKVQIPRSKVKLTQN